MNTLYSTTKFKTAKPSTKYLLECKQCHSNYYRTKTYIQDKLKNGHEPNFCSRQCERASKNTQVLIHCTQCNKEFYRPKAQVKEHNFCSRSCSAKYNNSRKVRKKKLCSICKTNEIKSPRSKYCVTCNPITKLEDKTLHDIIITTSGASNRYTAIRDHARRRYIKPGLPCSKCGYNKHVEVCHITPISDFPLDTKVSVINHKNNILILCPNCHWEHDNL